MKTKSIRALAAVALATAACSSDSPGTSTSGDTGLMPTQMADVSQTMAKPTSTSTDAMAATPSGGGAARSATTPAVQGGAGMNGAVTTGSATTPATSGPRTAAAGTTGASAQAGMGAAGSLADDADAGMMDDVGAMAAAGSGGSAEGSAGMAGMLAAGTGGAGAGGSSAEGPTSLSIPDDPSKPGPWPVGVRTVTLDLGVGNTPVEVWYPAKVGSESERSKVSYDLTAWLPPEHGIPASAPKVHIDCDCYRELPPDLDHGPYPVVVVVHGQASFRAAAASQMTHWASRGFVVIAADHPGLEMRDALAVNPGCSGSGIPQDYAHTRDVPALFGALAQSDGIFSFLKGGLDMQRIALGGHGDGAAYAADNAAQMGVKLVMSFSDATAIQREGELSASFYLSGMSDKIVAYNNVVRAYENTGRVLRPTLLAGMANVGHLGFTDLCGARNSDGQDAIAMARRYNICGGAAVNVADQYFWDCPLSPVAGPDNYLDQAATTALVRKLSTLALDEFLRGEPRAQAWNDLGADTSWGELRQTR